jgi:hypothetical protein
MKGKLFSPLIFVFIVFASCTKNGVSDGSSAGILSGSGGGSGSGAGSGSGGSPTPAGVITAGEWRDLDNWIFWDSLVGSTTYNMMPGIWHLYNNNRVSVHLTGTNSLPVADAAVKLKKNGLTIFSAKTDNRGDAELWASLFELNTTDFSQLTIDVNNGAQVINAVKPFSLGINNLITPSVAPDNFMQIAFVVDATGSMQDELSYLKTEVLDVINRAKNNNPGLTLSTSAVFYRDIGDEYVTRISNFTNNTNTSIDFIKNQIATGGGDFPEAVDIALDKSVNELSWLPGAKTRILFLILDAPPHKLSSNIMMVQNGIAKAAEKGIKVIPISASGVDKETEFLLRFMAISTNGTYVFITNDSGIGNNHIAASVGPYQVEYLNNLMVRLINKYAE